MGHAAAERPYEGRFANHRTGWILVGILSLFVPFLWPIGIYIHVELYQTRDRTPAMPVPPIDGSAWQ